MSTFTCLAFFLLLVGCTSPKGDADHVGRHDTSNTTTDSIVTRTVPGGEASNEHNPIDSSYMVRDLTTSEFYLVEDHQGMLAVRRNVDVLQWLRVAMGNEVILSTSHMRIIARIPYSECSRCNS